MHRVRGVWTSTYLGDTVLPKTLVLALNCINFHFGYIFIFEVSQKREDTEGIALVPGFPKGSMS